MCGWLLDLIARLLVPDSALRSGWLCLGDIFGLALYLDPELTREDWDRPPHLWWLR